MWKKWLAFSGMLGFIIVLDPTHTPAQPGGWGDKGGFGGPGGPGGPGGGWARPRGGGSGPGGPVFSAPVGPGQPGTIVIGGPGGGFGGPGGGFGGPGGGFGGPGGPGGGFGGPGGGFGGPGGGFGGPGGGFGGPGGPGGGRRGMDPERGWAMLQRLTGSTGDTVDLSKIPPQTATMLKGMVERSGGIPLPESGIMTKAQYLDHNARSEAQRASAGGAATAPAGPNGGWGGNNGGWGGNNNGWAGNGGGWGGPNGGWGGPGGGDPNGGRGFEKKDAEEEKPVAMRYGKLPKDLPSWFEEYDTDKDGQIGLYEWRKAGKDTKEFMEMDLNGDGLITADEYLRFTRQRTISDKVAAYQDGTREPGNWGLGEKLDSGSVNTKGPAGPGGSSAGRGPGGNPWGKGSAGGGNPKGGKGGGGGKGNWNKN